MKFIALSAAALIAVQAVKLGASAEDIEETNFVAVEDGPPADVMLLQTSQKIAYPEPKRIGEFAMFWSVDPKSKGSRVDEIVQEALDNNADTAASLNMSLKTIDEDLAH